MTEQITSTQARKIVTAFTIEPELLSLVDLNAEGNRSEFIRTAIQEKIEAVQAYCDHRHDHIGSAWVCSQCGHTMSEDEWNDSIPF